MPTMIPGDAPNGLICCSVAAHDSGRKDIRIGRSCRRDERDAQHEPDCGLIVNRLLAPRNDKLESCTKTRMQVGRPCRQCFRPLSARRVYSKDMLECSRLEDLRSRTNRHRFPRIISNGEIMRSDAEGYCHFFNPGGPLHLLPIVMAFMLDGWFKTDDDNINDLPPDFRDIYVNPWKIFGVSHEAAPWELRDAFRQRCLQMTPAFTGLQVSAKRTFHSFRQVLFAYRMCTGELAGPAGKLSQSLGASPLLQNTNPWDVLNTLRPLKAKGVIVGPSARASKMLAVQLKSALTVFGGKGASGFPRVAFELEVSYCMRTHRVEKFLADFEELHANLASELIILPNFPEGGGLGAILGGKQDLGRELCAYVQRVHTLLAQRGVFSPRVMEFLKVDFGRVHIEEEGRVVSENLDSRNLLPDTCWQAVEEGWLVRWRKFVLGRGARRYHAPGEIDNRPLLVVCAPNAAREGLVLGEDYRLVNYNVWKYWLLVYGGGPSIGRASKDIYGRPAIARPAAVVAIQASIRGFLGRKRTWREYLFRLAMEHAGAKEALYERKLLDIKEAALLHIRTARQRRQQGRMTRAALFTQVEWRRKKGYMYQADRLETQQYIQDVFEKAESSIREPPKNKPIVVREVKSIVNIGGAEEYDVRFDEDTGLTIGLRQRGGSVRGGRVQDAVGHVVGSSGADGGSGTGGEQTIVFEVPAELHGQVKKESVLLAINNMPVTNMSHQKAIAHIRQAPWPLVLRFRLPLDERDVFSLSEIANMKADGRFSEDIVLEHLKRKLLRGQKLLRFPSRRGVIRRKPYLTLLSIDEHNLYYQGKDRVSVPEGSRRGILLYNLKFVTKGKSTTILQKGARRVSEDACFSLAAEGKVLDFAIPSTIPDDGKSGQRCDLLVWGLRSLIREMQGSQVYVDKDGAVKRRVRPKDMLTTVVVNRKQHQRHQHQHAKPLTSAG